MTSCAPSLCGLTVLDTNTVMALWHFADPALATLRCAFEAGQGALVCRADCLAELERVLAYPAFARDAAAQAALLADYTARCVVLPPGMPDPALPRCRDADDQKFLDLAAQAGAARLVTRDRALLRLARHRLIRDRFEILTPECLEARLVAPPLDAGEREKA